MNYRHLPTHLDAAGALCCWAQGEIKANKSICFSPFFYKESVAQLRFPFTGVNPWGCASGPASALKHRYFWEEKSPDPDVAKISMGPKLV